MRTTRSNRLLVQAAFAMGIVSALPGCGGGAGSSGGGDDTGTLSASLTDAAIDEVVAVNLRVLGLRLRMQGAGEDAWVDVDLRHDDGSALEVNLLDYQNGETFTLFEDERVPAGLYEHARLVLEAPAQTPIQCRGQDPMEGSHVEEIGGGLVPVFVPSAAEAGVRLVSPFRVPLNGSAEVIIDFDLRQSLFVPAAFTGECYFVRPAFRVEAIENTGRIAGEVDVALLDGSNGLCSDDDPATGNSVYVYRGADAIPGDINGDENATTAAPYATAAVEFDPLAGNSGEGSYMVSFLPADDYTVAFTCRGDEERLPNDDSQNDDERLAVDSLDFQLPQNASVVAQQTSVVTFTADDANEG